MNAARVVRDHAEQEIAELEDEIRQLTEKLRSAQQELVTIKTLQAIAATTPK